MSNVTCTTHEKPTNINPFEQIERDIQGDMTETQIDNQSTVRMDKLLKKAIEDWLQTDEAKSKGYKSLAQFINKGARQLYEIESTPEDKPTHFVLPNMKDHRLTLDLDIYSDRNHCNMCDSEKCIHIEILNSDKTVKKYLKKYNIDQKS